MGKKKTNAIWATLMPVFSPQQKGEKTLDLKYQISVHEALAHNGLLIYMTADKEIDFSVSVLAAMNAQAPVESNDGDVVLTNSPWNGPEIFTDYILGSVTVPSSSSPSMSAEEIQNKFLVSSGLYGFNVKTGLLSPNPDFDLATAMMDTKLGQPGMAQTPNSIKDHAPKEFYQLLLPDTYGFSTTLILPNQADVDSDASDKKVAALSQLLDTKTDSDAEKDLDNFMKKYWPADKRNPYEDNPYDNYPPKKSKGWPPVPAPGPYDYSNPDYDKYRDWLKKMKEQGDDDWGTGKYGGSSGASAADQAHKK